MLALVAIGLGLLLVIIAGIVYVIFDYGRYPDDNSEI